MPARATPRWPPTWKAWYARPTAPSCSSPATSTRGWTPTSTTGRRARTWRVTGPRCARWTSTTRAAASTTAGRGRSRPAPHRPGRTSWCPRPPRPSCLGGEPLHELRLDVGVEAGDRAVGADLEQQEAVGLAAAVLAAAMHDQRRPAVGRRGAQADGAHARAHPAAAREERDDRLGAP